MRELSADHPHHHLLSPGRIGTLQLRNRILMCPMGDAQATDGGYVTPQQLAYFEADASRAEKFLSTGDAPRHPASAAPSRAAAAGMVANTLLNLDSCVVKR